MADLFNITLWNIDDLREIAEKNLKARLEAAKKAEMMVLKELKRLERLLRSERAEPLITAIFFEAEEIRHMELNHALRMLGDLDEEKHKTVKKLTQVLTKRILHTPIQKLREAVASNDINTIKTDQVLFNVNLHRGGVE